MYFVAEWSLGGLDVEIGSGCRDQRLDGDLGACLGFVILLLVFHIITSWTKEKNYLSQRTSQSEKEDTSRKIRHLVVHGLSLSLAARERSGCTSKPYAFIK